MKSEIRQQILAEVWPGGRSAVVCEADPAGIGSVANVMLPVGGQNRTWKNSKLSEPPSTRECAVFGPECSEETKSRERFTRKCAGAFSMEVETGPNYL